MDPRVEAALVTVLDRAESGADVSEAYLRETYPDFWSDLAEFLSFFGRLQRGRPRRDTLGPYRILRRLGQGGMGAVYVARVERPHEGLAAGTHVAVKVVHRHLLERPGFLQRTLREARLGRSVVHPNVVRTLDVGVETKDGVDEAYLVTEYVEGQNLRGLLHDAGAVPEHLCRTIARGVLEGLVAIHAAGIVHRDLKPENVVIAGTGADATVKVMDLGAARPAEELARISGPAEFAGSILYAAPEQFGLLRATRAQEDTPRSPVRAEGGRPIDGRADLYALGVMLQELATGRHPFASGVPRRRVTLGRGRPVVSAFFGEFGAALAAEEPDDRIASAAEALAVLREGETSAWWRSRVRGAAAPAPIPGPAAFIGRAAEMAALEAAAGRAFTGPGGCVVVEGEAGAGKSRLLAEFAARLAARGDGTLVVAAFCGGAAGLADALVAALRTPAGADPAPSPEGVAAALRSLAAVHPVVLTVEDLHAASREGRELFAAVARAVAGSRTLILATTRPGGAGDAEQSSGATRLRLGRLEPSATRELLCAATAPEAPSPRLKSLAEHWSGGNPFFLLEILAALRDDGLLVAGAGGGLRLREDAPTPQVPDTLRELVRARLDALSGEDRELLDAAACCGFEFDPAHVAAALGAPVVLVARRLAQLERQHNLVRGAGARCTFDHPLVREVLAEEIEPAVAARLHASLGAALEQAPDGGAGHALVARHFLLAGDAARAAPHLPEALRDHASAFRFDAALELCDLALGHVGRFSEALRLDLLRAKADCLRVLARRADELAVVREALGLALSLGDAAAASELRPALARSLHAAGRHDDALAEARRALADARSQSDAQAVLATVLGHIGRETEALHHAEAHLALCVASGDSERAVAAHVLVAEMLRHLNRVGDAHRRLEEAVAAAHGLAATSRAARTARLRLGKSLTSLGRLDEAALVLEEAAAAARSCTDRGGEIEALEALSLARSRLGEWDAALVSARRSAELADVSGDANALLDALMRCASVLKWMGRSREALEHYDRALELCLRHGYGLGEVTTRAYRSIQLTGLGEFRAARDDAEAARALVVSGGYDTVLALVHWALGLTSGADTTPDVGSLREAARLARADILPPVRAEIALALAAADSSAASARAALDAANAANLASAAVVASAYLAALGQLPAAAVLAEFERHGHRLSVARRLEAQFVLWRVTNERRLLDGAHRDLELLRDGAPPRCRDSLVSRVTLHAAVAAAWAARQ